MNKRNVISNLLLISSILFLGYILVITRNKPDGEVSYLFGYKPFIITTGSMEPTYPVNTLVIVKQTSHEEVAINDPIAFYSPIFDNFVFHRVIDITDEGFITKGDFNDFIDSDLVLFEHLIGKAVFYTTLSVPIINLLSQPMGFLLVVCVPISIVCIGFIVHKRNTKE